MLVGAAVIAAWALLTRFLHWDGLADTTDGLLGGSTPERRLEIMRDSRVGSFGVTAIVMVALLQVVGHRRLSWPRAGSGRCSPRRSWEGWLRPVAALDEPAARSDGLGTQRCGPLRHLRLDRRASRARRRWRPSDSSRRRSVRAWRSSRRRWRRGSIAAVIAPRLLGAVRGRHDRRPVRRDRAAGRDRRPGDGSGLHVSDGARQDSRRRTGAREACAGPEAVEVLIARHPEVEANVVGAFVGSGESPFTDLGRRQAAALAACDRRVEARRSVHASPRERARVGRGAGRALVAGVPLHVDDDLAEIDFGAAEGLTYEEASLRGVDDRPARRSAGDGAVQGRRDVARLRVPGREGRRAHRDVRSADRRGHARRRDQGAADALARACRTSRPGDSPLPNATIATITLWDGYGTLRTFGVEPGRCSWES